MLGVSFYINILKASYASRSRFSPRYQLPIKTQSYTLHREGGAVCPAMLSLSRAVISRFVLDSRSVAINPLHALYALFYN